jgi:hypothetical protein
MSEEIKQEYSIENDPLFKPISDEKKKKIDNAVERQVRSMSLDENVDKDDSKVSGQNYALISVVSPDSNQKSKNLCLKIKGVFNNLEEANKHAEMLQKIDSVFDIYVVEMYSWLLLPPDPTLIEQKHVDEKLNEIIGGHRESQLKAKMYFDERKRELIENINLENDERKKENEKLKENEENSNLEEIDESAPEGISAESSINITQNGNECPNSGPSAEKHVMPSEIMEEMVKDKSQEKPSKDFVE